MGGSTVTLAECCDRCCDNRRGEEDAESYGSDLRENEHEAPHALHALMLRKAELNHIVTEDDFHVILQE